MNIHFTIGILCNGDKATPKKFNIKPNQFFKAKKKLQQTPIDSIKSENPSNRTHIKKAFSTTHNRLREIFAGA